MTEETPTQIEPLRQVMTCCDTHPDGIAPRNPEHHPVRLFAKAAAEGRPLRILAPMVRYSKLPFRALVRSYGLDLCYTPMLLAKEFIRSQPARLSDFTTSCLDGPTVVQWGTSSPVDVARASEMVKPFCDGVSINCGCPQTWAIHEGIGCALMQQPELVRDMVKAIKERCGQGFSVGVKIRIHLDIEETKRWVRTVLGEGNVDYITVHGRRRTQRSSEVPNFEAIRVIRDLVKEELGGIPVVANGDVESLEAEERIVKVTKADGVMTARALLTNPALFAGYKKTPWGAVERIVSYCLKMPIPYPLAKYHVGEMLSEVLGRKERKALQEQRCWADLLDWLDEKFVLLREGEEGWGEGVDIPRRVTENPEGAAGEDDDEEDAKKDNGYEAGG
ncbi:tRNA-dihydrouridine synthase [Ascobolus immersus RN42]|uniref:tRNA-dihydrouridine(20a/20b) synthase [NAD(P)+] n=1 Tax=Ascobolus immersus RN42 TaxID=1160509 RepID=A0A3N4IUU1_ASCIM|nr:tRNA-dihydrouridine synthase [Ascobolus immersus RN42]